MQRNQLQSGELFMASPRGGMWKRGVTHYVPCVVLETDGWMRVDPGYSWQVVRRGGAQGVLVAIATIGRLHSAGYWCLDALRPAQIESLAECPSTEGKELCPELRAVTEAAKRVFAPALMAGDSSVVTGMPLDDELRKNGVHVDSAAVCAECHHRFAVLDLDGGRCGRCGTMITGARIRVAPGAG